MNRVIGFIPEDYGAAQTQGRRNYQEDDFDARLDLRGRANGSAAPDLLAVLADGMGGENAGDVASAMAVRGFMDAYRERRRRGTPRQRLDVALEQANDAIGQATSDDPSLSGMGCTLVALLIEETHAWWISVGDSPLWLYRDRSLIRLNADHSYGGLLDEMVREGRIEPETASRSRRRNLLISAITGASISRISRSNEGLELRAGDLFILASDGLLSLTESEICHELDPERAPDDMARGLISAVDAKDLRAQDNATVQVVRCIDRLEARRAPWWNPLRPSASLMFTLTIALSLAGLAQGQ